jgi:hypothetical protein
LRNIIEKEVKSIIRRIKSDKYEYMVCTETPVGPKDGPIFEKKMNRVLISDDYGFTEACAFVLYVWKKPE